MKILSRDSPQRIFIKGERVLVFLPLSTLLRLLPRFMPKFLRCYVAKERKEKSGPVRESRKSPENEIHGECAVNYSTIGSKLTMGTVRFDAGDSQKGFLFVKIFNLLNLLKLIRVTLQLVPIPSCRESSKDSRSSSESREIYNFLQIYKTL